MTGRPWPGKQIKYILKRRWCKLQIPYPVLVGNPVVDVTDSCPILFGSAADSVCCLGRSKKIDFK